MTREQQPQLIHDSFKRSTPSIVDADANVADKGGAFDCRFPRRLTTPVPNSKP
jgi:hypothetical protein